MPKQTKQELYIETHKLRHECHQLLDDIFANKSPATRYVWLNKRGYKQHMSQMQKFQLECLKNELIMIDEKESNPYRN